jgi:hypothetical protein
MVRNAPDGGTGPTPTVRCPPPKIACSPTQVYVKTNVLQVVQGELFAMPQNKANQCIHTLLLVLQTTLRRLGDAPARSMEHLAQRLGLSCVLSEPVEAQAVSQDHPPFLP